jgi:hypothetical protein
MVVTKKFHNTIEAKKHKQRDVAPAHSDGLRLDSNLFKHVSCQSCHGSGENEEQKVTYAAPLTMQKDGTSIRN